MADLTKLSVQEISDKGQFHMEAAQRCFEEMIRRSCNTAAENKENPEKMKVSADANAFFRLGLARVIQASAHGLNGVVCEHDVTGVTPLFGGK